MVALYGRLRHWGLIYLEIMEPKDLSSGKWSTVGMVLLLAGVISGIVIGNLVSLGIYQSGFLGSGFAQGARGELGVSLGLLPSILLIFLGAVLM
jgi:hypothetical protein